MRGPWPSQHPGKACTFAEACVANGWQPPETMFVGGLGRSQLGRELHRTMGSCDVLRERMSRLVSKKSLVIVVVIVVIIADDRTVHHDAISAQLESLFSLACEFITCSYIHWGAHLTHTPRTAETQKGNINKKLGRNARANPTANLMATPLLPRAFLTPVL